SSEQKQKQIAIEKAEEASMAGKVGMERAAVEVTVRELDVERDLPAVEELERRCEVGLSGDQADGGKKKKKKSMSLCVEQIGDPLARVRHAPEHVMLVAECGVEMVGVVKACIKMVSRGRGIGSSSSSGSVAKQQQPATAYVKVAFILGLRVSPSHRRLGIATALVKAAEEWSRKRGAAHATMATTESNKASLALFTGRFGYKQFRRPVLLGRPVHARWLPVTSRHRVLQLPPTLAAAAYARLLPPQDTEFLPADLPALLAHKLTLGTFVAIESSDGHTAAAGAPSPSFAVLSVWDQTRSLRLRVDGAPALLRHSLAAVRALDRAARRGCACPPCRTSSAPSAPTSSTASACPGRRARPCSARSAATPTTWPATTRPAASSPPTSAPTTRPPPPSRAGAASPATRTSGASRTSPTAMPPPPPPTGRHRRRRAACSSSTPASS
uniref:N-acetyltransferase domain-containing protein n=2 Tax=Aegilops tauschii subsp. strangulata TaxID=200361 RepID=A0A453T4R9_AEGTS